MIDSLDLVKCEILDSVGEEITKLREAETEADIMVGTKAPIASKQEAIDTYKKTISFRD